MSPSLRARASTPVDLAGLAVFRVMFGAVMLVDALRYLLAGWVDGHFVEPAVRFTYYGFHWVEPLPRTGMIAVFVGIMLASAAVAVGAAYRVAAWLLVLGHAYVFLLAASHYLNHAYLLGVIALLMACMPAARGLSVDAWRRPGWRRAWTPAWAPWLLRVQLSIVYVYGGLAKVNADWLAGEPVRGWLWQRAQSAPAWMAELLRSEAVVGLVVQGGLWFDLLVAPALWWRRTRVLAVLASLGFHLGNAWLFHIGVFPWFMLLATTLFFEPGWPRRVPGVGRLVDAWLPATPPQQPAALEPSATASRWVPWACGAWIVVQGLVPLRHHLYPGDVAWTEEGHYFAWRMKLRTKSGSARFIVHAPATGQSWVVDPADELTQWQVRKMVAKPDLVLQYAHHLAERWQAERGLEVEVRAQVHVSLNRRARRPLVDPEVDLARVRASLLPAPWILPGPTEPVPRSLKATPASAP